MLLERAKFLLKDTALYGLANGLSRFMTFLMIPLIVNHISVAEFGTWNLLTIIGGIVAGIAIMGMDSAVVRYYYEDESVARRNQVFTNGFVIQVALVLTAVAIGFLVPDLLLRPVGVPLSYKTSLYWVLAWMPASVLTFYTQNWFKWTFQRYRFLTISLGTALANMAALAVLIGYGELNLSTVLISQACATWLFAFVGIWWCRKNFASGIDSVLAMKLVRFGFPMMLVMLMSLLSPALDRLFLVRFLDPVQLGIYSFCQKLSIIAMVAVTAFQTAFGPFSYSLWDQPEARQTFSRFQTYYIMAACVVGIGVCCLSDVLINLLGTADYRASSTFLPLLVTGVIIYGLYSFAAIGIFYSRRMVFNLLSLSLGVGANVTLNFLLIPRFGEYGAAAGYASGNIVLVAAAYTFSTRFYKVDYSFTRDLLIVLAAFLGMTASNYLNLAENVYLASLIKVGIILPPFALIVLLLMRKPEREFLSQQLAKVRPS